ncbi:MAG: 3-phosphoshikimate 1-carboxyvinyltransferase [Oscillospiraceae bacterium]
MKALIKNTPLAGKITAPPSKSYAHRALICAALAEKPTKILLSSVCEDVFATAAALSAMGGGFEETDGGIILTPIDKIPPKALINCGESGSTLRFLLPLAAALIKDGSFIGSGRLPQRPIGELLTALSKNGAVFGGDKLPLSVFGGLKPGSFELSGEQSSQFVSGLLLALPILSGDSEIILKNPLVSAPYVDITLQVMKDFSVEVSKTHRGFSIPGGQKYRSPGEYSIEGDWSAAAYFLAAGALGSGVSLSGLSLTSKQGDRAILDYLSDFGAEVSASEASVQAFKRPLRGREIDISQTPDLLPILALLACGAQGKSRFFNAARLRNKESDRLQSSAALINALGGKAFVSDDGLEVFGSQLIGGTVDAAHDHRIAMCAAIAALICEKPVQILGAEAIKKSYPRFFDDFSSLGGTTEFSEREF